MACLKTALWILWVFTNLQNSSCVHSLTSPLITIKEKNIPFGLLKALTQESPWVKVGSVCSKRGLGVQGQRPAGCSAHKVAGPLEKISQSISWTCWDDFHLFCGTWQKKRTNAHGSGIEEFIKLSQDLTKLSLWVLRHLTILVPVYREMETLRRHLLVGLQEGRFRTLGLGSTPRDLSEELPQGSEGGHAGIPASRPWDWGKALEVSAPHCIQL